MQLGPISRMPAACAFATISRSIATISGSPVSASPAVKECSERTPFSMHWSTSCGRPLAGIWEMT